MKQELVQQIAKTTGDITSLGVVIATISNYLPAVAALFSIIWCTIRIFETDTVKNLIKKWRKN